MIRHATPLALAALALLPLPATRAATFRVTGSVTQSFAVTTTTLDSYDKSGYAETGDQAKYDSFDNSVPNTPSYHASASSLAGPTGLHASAHSSVLKSDQFGASYGFSQTGTSFAQATYTDVTFSPPAGSNATSVSVSFNLHLDGSDIVGSTLTPAGSTYGSATTQVSFFVNNQNVGGGYYTRSSFNGGDVTGTSGGSLSSFTGNGNVLSPTFTVPVNTPVTLEFNLSVSAGVSTTRDDQSIDLVANADFGDTLTFATDRPVFNLPAGYTVNSPDAGIINNTYSLPEPASLLLAIPALLTRTRRPRRA